MMGPMMEKSGEATRAETLLSALESGALLRARSALARGGPLPVCAACRLTESGRRRADDAVTGPDRGRGYDAFVRFDGGDGRRLWRVGV